MNEAEAEFTNLVLHLQRAGSIRLSSKLGRQIGLPFVICGIRINVRALAEGVAVASGNTPTGDVSIDINLSFAQQPSGRLIF